jgi:hypothetical protein
MTAATTLRLVLAAACAAVLGTAALALAQGQTVEIQAEVKLRDRAPAFHGKVVADNENCVEDRTVKMFKQKRSGGKRLLGKDHAANGGKWTVRFDKVASGGYFAVAPHVEQGTAGTIYDCLRAKSRVLTID